MNSARFVVKKVIQILHEGYLNSDKIIVVFPAIDGSRVGDPHTQTGTLLTGRHPTTVIEVSTLEYLIAVQLLLLRGQVLGQLLDRLVAHSHHASVFDSGDYLVGVVVHLLLVKWVGGDGRALDDLTLVVLSMG